MEMQGVLLRAHECVLCNPLAFETRHRLESYVLFAQHQVELEYQAQCFVGMDFLTEQILVLAQCLNRIHNHKPLNLVA